MARPSEGPAPPDRQPPVTAAVRAGDCDSSLDDAVRQLGRQPAADHEVDVVTLPSSLSDDITGAFGQSLRELARRPGGRVLVLDASDTADASVRGLALVLAVSRSVRSRGGCVRVVNANSDVQMLLGAAGAGECT